MGSGAVPQRKDILQTGLRAGHSKASRADLNFTNALREGLFLLALARAAPIARRLVAPPACGAFNVGLTSPALALAWWNPECRLCGVERTLVEHRNFSVGPKSDIPFVPTRVRFVYNTMPCAAT